MSIFDKLKFWKKDEDEFLGDKPEPLPGAKPDMGQKDELGLPEMPDRAGEPETPKIEDPGVAPPPHLRDYQPTQPSPHMQQPMMQQGMPPQHQLEIINSKLDAIKAILSALEQRIANVERMSRNEKKYW